MAFGLPVLCSLSGEARSFLDEHRCGVNYNAGNAESLAASIIMLQNNSSLRQEYGSNGLRLYEQVYSAEKVYTGMADYLEAVASGKKEIAITASASYRAAS
jgi:glycosyltransferase involved in cell wall biosynthesis